MRPSHRLLLLVPLALAGCGSSPDPADGGGADAASIDGGGGDDAAIDGGGGGDASTVDGGSTGDAGGDGGSACGPECPPGWCFDGSCVPGGCCATGFCPRGDRCDYDSCGCVPATGCCAGEACGSGELCDPYSCTCAREDDCCVFGRCDFPMICDGACGCRVDDSCSPACAGDSVCFYGSCMARCVFEGCPDSLFCSETEGCVAPRCTEEECVLQEPPLACDPGRGCYDPCAESDFSWCTASGGRCVLGTCVDDTCASGTLTCTHVNDCCGNVLCWDVASGMEPYCDPSSCPPVPEMPLRYDLCLCSAGRFFPGPIPAGGAGGGPPPPPGGGYCVELGGRTGGGFPMPFPGGGGTPPPR